MPRQNPYGVPVRRTTGNPGGPTYHPDLTTEDPKIMATQDRTFAYDRGNNIDADIRGEQGYRSDLEGYYRPEMNAAYGDLYDTPGYTPEEIAGITRQSDLDRLPVSRDEASSWQLTDDEWMAISGNPHGVRASFDPGRTEAIARETAGSVTGSIDDWGNRSRGAYSTMGDNTRNALNRAQLGPSEGYTGAQDEAISGGESSVRGALGSYGSSINQYMNDPGLQFTPQNEADMVQAASTSIGNATRAKKDAVAREAAASGNQSALALTAGMNDLQTQGDINAEDAALNAKVAARELGLNASQRRSALGIQAAGDLEGQTASNEQRLADRRLNAAGEREGYRSAAERARMTADIANEQYLGDSLINLEGDIGRNRASYNLQTGRDRQDANLWNQNTGMGIERDVDETQSERAKWLASNRQGTQMAGQGRYFDQGFTVNQAGSQRAQTVADARRTGQGEYRNWTTGQTGSAVDAGATARGQRTQAYGTQGQIAGNATSTQAQYRTANPSFGRTFSQSFGRELGGGLGRGVTGAVFGSGNKKNGE